MTSQGSASMAAAPAQEASGTVRGLTRVWRRRGAAAPLTGTLTDRVLAARGLSGSASAEFLAPTLREMHDPSLMPGLDRAARRLLDAARAREPIVIYGDYDVDGITASAIVFRMLRAVAPGAAVRTYVPHRVDEGYGLNEQAVRSLAQAGARVIVTVDCGVTAAGPALAALEAGVDLIITDHHNPPSEAAHLPRAYAIVHPALPGAEPYPFRDLCGAGVAYKLAWRLATLASGADRATSTLRELLIELLPLAALGTIADVVPLHGENRVIARFGLGRCKHSPIVGLRALVEASRLSGAEIDAESVGFRLGPRLNASGRLGHAAEAVELFITEDAARAAEIAAGLDRLNTRRGAEEKRIFEEALRRAEAAGMDRPDRRAIVLADESWHPGVVGIVCSRLTERLCRPAILMQRQPGDQGPVCTGSGRGVDGFNLHAALTSCAGLLTRFGGHDAAAGLALPADRLDAFTEAFTEHANRVLREEDLVRSIDYDTEAEIADLTLAATRDLDRLGPFGRGNPGVSLRIVHARVAEPPRPMGEDGRHVALRLEDARGPGSASVRVVGWGMADIARDLARGVAVEALVAPKVSAFKGRVACEPELLDLRPLREASAQIVVRSRQSVVTPA